MSARLSSLFISPRPSFHLPSLPRSRSRYPSGSLVMPACFIASYTFPQSPPATLCFWTHPWYAPSFIFHCSCSAPISHSHSFLGPRCFAPSVCPVTPSSPSSLSPAPLVPTSRLISYFLPPPSLFALPPPSVIPSSSSLSVSVYWVLSSTHSLVDKWFILPKNPHHRPQTSLFNQPLLLHSCHSLAGCR